MIKVENIHVYNLANAIYSARNPLNSWAKSDSDLKNDVLGENDLSLAQKLYAAGPEHRKYLRQIFVSMDITAPLYLWKEADQHKIGTTTNSCSTMHKLASRDLTLDDFSREHLSDFNTIVLQTLISTMNESRRKYIETKDKNDWWQMIQLLPASYNQKRTLTMNYENVVSMIHQRTGHKLDEWKEFVEILKGLPYIMEITKGEF